MYNKWKYVQSSGTTLPYYLFWFSFSGILAAAWYRSNNCNSCSSQNKEYICSGLNWTPIFSVAVFGPFIPTCFDIVIAYFWNERALVVGLVIIRQVNSWTDSYFHFVLTAQLSMNVIVCSGVACLCRLNSSLTYKSPMYASSGGIPRCSLSIVLYNFLTIILKKII